jgi:hypothetical protein
MGRWTNRSLPIPIIDGPYRAQHAHPGVATPGCFIFFRQHRFGDLVPEILDDRQSMAPAVHHSDSDAAEAFVKNIGAVHGQFVTPQKTVRVAIDGELPMPRRWLLFALRNL